MEREAVGERERQEEDVLTEEQFATEVMAQAGAEKVRVRNSVAALEVILIVVLRIWGLFL